MGRVAKSVKISTDQFFTQKISTKTAWFTTFPKSRQNSVNGQILALVLLSLQLQHWCYYHCSFQHRRCYYQCFTSTNIRNTVYSAISSVCYGISDIIIGHNGTVVCMLQPKISTSWKKLAPTGRHGRHVFATLIIGIMDTLFLSSFSFVHLS